MDRLFQSTHPSWGATSTVWWETKSQIFQSTHPSWGATLLSSFICFARASISIHAPIVGCDRIQQEVLHQVLNFNPRTHRGVRHYQLHYQMAYILFQSTHPSWGATGRASLVLDLRSISIHAPIVGCDYLLFFFIIFLILFQSTHPSWGATLCFRKCWLGSDYFNPRTHRGVRRFFNVCCQ